LASSLVFRAAATQSPALAIEIGTGLSTRDIAHAQRHPDMRWVDYDLPHMVRARRRMLAGHELPRNYTLATGDLLARGLGPTPTAGGDGPVIAMTEGVTDYLDRREKQRAWQHIAAQLTRLGGGRYLLEVHPRDRVAHFGPAAAILLDALRRISARDLLGQLCASAGEAIDLLINSGFAHARVLPEAELSDADRAPPPKYRPFSLIEAKT